MPRIASLITNIILRIFLEDENGYIYKPKTFLKQPQTKRYEGVIEPKGCLALKKKNNMFKTNKCNQIRKNLRVI